jgi:hypothetical protein
VGVVLISLIVVFTSWIAYHATEGHAGSASLRAAFGAFLEFVGMYVLFFAANLGLGFLIVLLVRAFSQRFLSIYFLGNVLLLILSAVQAFVFHYRRKRG